MRSIVLICLALSTVALSQPATRPAHDRPTTVPADETTPLSPAQVEVQKLQDFFASKDGEGFRAFVLLGGDPDAADKLAEFSTAVSQGALAEARVVPLAEKTDGAVTVVAAGFLRKPGDRRPDIDSTYLVQREGRLRVVLGGSGHLAIMSDDERASSERLAAWYDEWIAANRVEARKRLAEVE
jgi:hypothetical protein